MNNRNCQPAVNGTSKTAHGTSDDADSTVAQQFVKARTHTARLGGSLPLRLLHTGGSLSEQRVWVFVFFQIVSCHVINTSAGGDRLGACALR
jgi:hypothetical protein